jgi:hypothetical protein
MTHVEDHKYNFEFKSFLEEYHSKDPIYSPLGIDLDNLPQEEDILDVVWPKKEDYQKQLDKYKDKQIGSITILKNENEEKLHKEYQRNISLMRSHSPTLKQEKNI